MLEGTKVFMEKQHKCFSIFPSFQVYTCVVILSCPNRERKFGSYFLESTSARLLFGPELELTSLLLGHSNSPESSPYLHLCCWGGEHIRFWCFYSCTEVQELPFVYSRYLNYRSHSPMIGGLTTNASVWHTQVGDIFQLVTQRLSVFCKQFL